MRKIVDKLVSDYYNNNVYRKTEFDSVLAANPGTVRALNDCVFLSYRKATASSIKERLIDAVSRMPGDTYKQKYCMAILSQANSTSLYISFALQYALYKIVTDEVEPCDIETFIADGGWGALLSSLNIKVLENIVEDIMDGLNEVQSEGSKEILTAASMM